MSRHMTLHEDVLERILNILKQDDYYRTLEDLPVIDELTRPRQPEKCLCFHCNLPGHLKRNCPKIPYCSKCRTKGHTQDRCTNRPQRTRHTHPAGKPRDQQKRKDDLPQFSSHHNKCLQCVGDHQTTNCMRQ